MPKPPPPPKPWERQPGEREQAYIYFCAYRDMEPPRRINDVAVTLGRKPETLWVHSRKWGWIKRVTAYDAWIEAKARAAMDREIDEEAARWRERFRRQAEAIYQRGENLLRAADRRLRISGVKSRRFVKDNGNVVIVREPVGFTFKDLAFVMLAGSKMQAQAIDFMLKQFADQGGGSDLTPGQAAAMIKALRDTEALEDDRPRQRNGQFGPGGIFPAGGEDSREAGDDIIDIEDE